MFFFFFLAEKDLERQSKVNAIEKLWRKKKKKKTMVIKRCFSLPKTQVWCCSLKSNANYKQLFNRKHSSISTIHVRTKEVGETCVALMYSERLIKVLIVLFTLWRVDFITMTNGLAINKELKIKRSSFWVKISP